MENKKILVINGHKHYWYSEGKLNKTLFDEIVKVLSPSNEIKTTIIEEGYNVEDEIQKYLWADLVIFQTPVNWFSIPWLFKKYIDEIYQLKIFYQGSEDYGRGGLLLGKKYMLSLTWNSPKNVFGKTGGFFDGRSVDDVFIAMHKLHEFCGMEKMETFSVHDVVKNPKVDEYIKELHEHLDKFILKS